jgi:hypothetical protein
LKLVLVFLYGSVYGFHMSVGLIFTPVVLFLLTSVFLVPVLFRLLRRSDLAEVTPEWLENFTTASYYPMEGLLAEEDFRFLSRQPGFDFSLYRKLRADRLRIFRQYLNRLIGDFNRLHAVARFLVAQGNEDHSDVAGQLILLRLRFSVSVLRVEASYLLCRFGWRSVAIGNLIARLEDMSGQLNAISAARLAASQSLSF